MKFHTTHIGVLLSLIIVNSYGATTFQHVSGDNTNSSGGVTGNVISQIIQSTNNNGIDGTYTGAHAAARSTTPSNTAFYNNATGTVEPTRYEFDISADGGGVTAQTNVSQDAFFVTASDDATSISFTFSYVGHSDGAGNYLTYGNGFTGRWSFPLGNPATNQRGFSFTNDSNDGGLISLDIAISAVEFGGASAVLDSNDFYVGDFQNDDYILPTTGLGTTSVSGSYLDDEGTFFHYGADLGDTLQSITYTVTPTGGGTFEEGSIFRLTFDTAVHSAIPEPSSQLFLSVFPVLLLLRRKRA